jgi:hypothetical protein
MMRSILFQILEQLPILWDCYQPEYETLKKIGQKAEWDIESMQRIIRNMAWKSDVQASIILLIDAMDESIEDRLRQVLTLFNELCHSQEQKVKFKVIVASRPVPRIEHNLRKNVTIRLEHQTIGDIERYVQKRTSWMIDEGPEHVGLMKNIRTTVNTNANGVFLWVKLVLNLLHNLLDDGCSLAEVRKTLYAVPQDLDSFYN